jgi:hypothetical protein
MQKAIRRRLDFIGKTVEAMHHTAANAASPPLVNHNAAVSVLKYDAHCFFLQVWPAKISGPHLQPQTHAQRFAGCLHA